MALPWGAIIQGVTGAAKAVGKGAAKGAKAAGKSVKSTAKSGKRIAQNMMGDRKDSVITSSTPKAIPGTPLIPSNITPKTSSPSTGVLSIDKALDRIDNSLFDLISYTADSSKVQKTSARRMNVERNIQRKRKRESILENTSKFIKAIRPRVPSSMKKTFDSMKNFLTNIALGSLLLYILQQWDKIVAWYEKTIDRIKEIWTRLEPIIIPIWKFLKWFGKWAVENTIKLVSFTKDTLNPDNLKRAVDDLKAMIKPVNDMFTGVMNFAKNIVGGKGNKKTEVPTASDDVNTSSAGNSSTSTSTGQSSSLSEVSSTMNVGVKPGSLLAMVDSSQSQSVSPDAVYDYLMSKGVSKVHAEGMMANIQAESTFRPGVLGDGGTSGGLFQHHGIRFAQMKEFVGKDWKTNWKGQIDYALSEGITKKYLATDFKSSADASRWFTINWERPENAKVKAEDRIKHLNNFAPYEQGGGTTNIILANQTQSSSGSGEGGVKILPVPIVNSTVEVAAEIHRYQLTTV